MAKKSSKKFQIDELKVLATALKKVADSRYAVQVGIFGAKTSRRESNGPTNAEVGLVHEMGSVSMHIPRRSFLLDTFANHGALLEAVLAPSAQKLFLAGRVDEYLKLAQTACVNLVKQAFDTGGFGAWPQDSYKTLLRKLRGSLKRRKGLLAQIYAGMGVNKPLIDTAQLMNAVDARAVAR